MEKRVFTFQEFGEFPVEICEGIPQRKDWNELQSSLQASQQFLSLSWFESWAKFFLPFGAWVGLMKYLSIPGDNGKLLGVSSCPYNRILFSLVY